MIKKCIFLAVVGVIGLIFVSLFGIKGMYSLNLGFLTPFIFKQQDDEREKQLLIKNYSQVFLLVLVIFINLYILSNFVEFGSYIMHNWLGFLISILFILLGLNGIRLLKK